MTKKNYQVFVDVVNTNKDWLDDCKIHVVDMIIAANNSEEARDLAEMRAKKEYQGLEYYVWEVTEDDVILS